MQYILINASSSVSRYVQSLVCVCVNMYDTRTVLGQPRERKSITTLREREGERIPQYPTEHWVIDLFFSAVSFSRQPLCAQLISIPASFKLAMRAYKKEKCKLMEGKLHLRYSIFYLAS